jgi:hypothetical protein
MPSVEKAGPGPGEEQQQLVADLFHALNQPLTALRCSLELALAKPLTAEQYRATLSRGVKDAAQVAWFSAGIRELLGASDPGDRRQNLALDRYLEDVVSDLLPLAESKGVSLSCTCLSRCKVYFEPHRLRQALFHLLEIGLEPGKPDSVARIQLSEHKGEAVLALSYASGAAAVLQNPATDPAASRGLQGCEAEFPPLELVSRLRMAMARGAFEAAAGVFRSSADREGSWIEIRLPLVFSS